MIMRHGLTTIKINFSCHIEAEKKKTHLEKTKEEKRSLYLTTQNLLVE